MAPALLFNRTNSPYHVQANKLLELLLQADSVSSGGDKEVRKRRKEVVKDVEGAIEELERKRDGLWSEVKERRENGAVESEDDNGHSSGSSTVDVEEHHSSADVEIPLPQATPVTDEVKFDPAVEEKLVEEKVVEEKMVGEKLVDMKQTVEADSSAEGETVVEKEEGYELV